MTLEVAGVSAGHAGTDVVHDVSLAVGAGRIVGVLGANGAGKTTLLRVLCGLLPASAGSVRLDGREVLGLPTHELARAGMVLVPAERHLFPDMTVADNLALGAYPDRLAPARRAAVHEVFPRLAERTRQRAGTLSGGEQQMLALARAMVREPRLLVLDEPSTGLAPRLATELFAVLATLAAAGTAVLVAEQQVPLVLGVAHHAHVLEGGRVVLAGTPGQLTADPRVGGAFLGTT